MKKIGFRRQNEGFTLAELLIVVAIIAVLIAIALPVFSNQLEKAREATDLANIRSAYSQVVTQSLTENTVDPIDVPLVQKTDDWQTPGIEAKLESLGTIDRGSTPSAGGACTVSMENGKVLFSFNGGTGSGTGTGTGSGNEPYYDANWTPVKKAGGLGKAFKDLLSSITIETDAGRYISTPGPFGFDLPDPLGHVTVNPDRNNPDVYEIWCSDAREV